VPIKNFFMIFSPGLEPRICCDPMPTCRDILGIGQRLTAQTSTSMDGCIAIPEPEYRLPTATLARETPHAKFRIL
jgi:hypothetical protein